MPGLRGWASALVLVACAPGGEALVLPPAPAEAHSVFLLIPLGAVVAPLGGAPPDLPVTTLGPEDPFVVVYSSASLAEMQLTAGALPSGGKRQIPRVVDVQERSRGGWSERTSMSELPKPFDDFGLPAFDFQACEASGGCAGLAPDADLCRNPCPCAITPAPWPDGNPPRQPPPRAQRCYSPPRLFIALNALGGRHGSVQAEAGQAIREGDDVWLYFSTDRFALPVGATSAYYPHVARTKLPSPSEVDEESTSYVPIVPEPTREGPAGWTSPPRLRADGAELFTHSSVPDANFADEELFVARRRAADCTFAPMEVIEGLTQSNNGSVGDAPGDEARLPLLFPDFATLLFRRGEETGIRTSYARRSTPMAGAIDFEHVSGEDPFADRWAAAALSADLTHLLVIVREGPNLTDVGRLFALPILELTPQVRYGPPVPLTLADGTPVELIDPWWDMTLTEHPDGSALYVGYHQSTWILEAIACD